MVLTIRVGSIFVCGRLGFVFLRHGGRWRGSYGARFTLPFESSCRTAFQISTAGRREISILQEINVTRENQEWNDRISWHICMVEQHINTKTSFPSVTWWCCPHSLSAGMRECVAVFWLPVKTASDELWSPNPVYPRAERWLLTLLETTTDFWRERMWLQTPSFVYI